VEELKNAPKLKPRITNSDSETDDGEDKSTDEKSSASIRYHSQSQGASLQTPSLTFNNGSDPTPSMDLLSPEETYKIKAAVRKRHRSTTTTESEIGTTKEEKDHQDFTETPILQSPPKTASLEPDLRKLDVAKRQYVMSPGMLTPSPTKTKYPRKKRRGSQQASDLGADDLLNMMSS